VLLKVCGATQVSEVEHLGGAGADLVGLWHGVPGGHAELGVPVLCRLAGAARDAGRPRPVLVTLSSDVDELVAVLRLAGIDWVQLHGYQPPGLVRALLAACPELTVVKVLHVRDGTCVEGRLMGAYRRAGAAMFLLDTVTADGRIGSTGESIDPDVVEALVAESPLPVVLAGGLDAGTAARYRPPKADRLLGIDVDTGARGDDGRIDPARVAAIRHELDHPTAPLAGLATTS